MFAAMPGAATGNISFGVLPQPLYHQLLRLTYTTRQQPTADSDGIAGWKRG
jgi:hypothetical protein